MDQEAPSMSKETKSILKMKLPRQIGFPGESFFLAFANLFRDPDGLLRQTAAEGGPGFYYSTFVLSKPGVRASDEGKFKTAELLRGDSHLAMAPPAVLRTAESEKMRFVVDVGSERFVVDAIPNDAGFLGKLETQPFEARNRRDATLRSTRAIQNALSELSIRLDIPLQVDQVEVTEVSTRNKSISCVSPFRAVEIPDATVPGTRDAEFSRLAALHREALNSNPPPYRFLCLYKILETSRKRREALGRKLKKSYRPQRDGEVVPSSLDEQLAWLAALFDPNRVWDESEIKQIFLPETRGKKLTSLFDTELRRVRDKIAHGILDSGEYLHTDDPDAVHEIAKWLPFLRCAIRRVLMNDFPDHYMSAKKDTAAGE